MSDWITALITALACFALCGVCGIYVYRASTRLRWSRSSKTWVLRHTNPTLYWAKLVVVGSGGLLSLCMGILLVAFHGHHIFHSADLSKPSLEQIPTEVSR